MKPYHIIECDDFNEICNLIGDKVSIGYELLGPVQFAMRQHASYGGSTTVYLATLKLVKKPEVE